VFRIRRIIDDVLPLDQKVVGQVQDILRERFPGLRPQEVDSLPEKLRNPLKYQFRSLLYVAERRGSVRGFALLLHEPELHFCVLDFLATRGQLSGTGTGGALYERVREEALALQAIGVFFECLPDDPDEGLPPDVLKANIARLRFYERYGARPLERNAYRMPTKPGEVGLPYLMFDDLVQKRPLRRDDIRKIVRAILERKYRHMCSPAYIDAVVQSFQDEPLPQRPPR
jgi:GNAT superfamily N-acetyltransferase